MQKTLREFIVQASQSKWDDGMKAAISDGIFSPKCKL